MRCAQIIELVVMAVLVAACGTRAGNPKKPEGDTPPKAVVTIPRFAIFGDDVAIPALDDSQGQLTKTLAEGPERARTVIDALNTLVDLLNEARIPLDDVFVKSYDDGELTAKVVRDSESEGYTYKGVFCADGKLFYETSWDDAGTRIRAVRDFERNPFGVADTSQQAGTAVKTEVELDLTGGLTKLSTRQHGLLAKPNLVYPGLDATTDYAYLESFADDYLYRGVFSYHDPSDAKTSDFAAQLHASGRLLKGGKDRVLAHSTGFPILCPGAFDESELDAPNWCLGVERDLAKRAPVLFDAAAREALWSEIKGIGVGRAADLRVVDFAEQCPESP